ncbi:hypothetical protein O1U_0060 [Candidatus Photodesmus katoptron Akat1]|uniref:DUF3466 family protein n=2 Tax=Candidatus Photodesmus anomalopis TaxID=28176 RepID=S3E075_9GAMM|nr:hypothetical protein O1U_0060 [Candidatus Photodesmus katoptron Akat1]
MIFQNKLFKTANITFIMIWTVSVNAALYKVVEVIVPSEISNLGKYTQTRGVAILPSFKGGALGCFGTYCESLDFPLAGETRIHIDAYNYREESPFSMDRSFKYIQKDVDFENYCYQELLYATCSSWANKHWIARKKELEGSTISNALAFVEYHVDAFPNELNNVINGLTSSAKPIGNQSIIGKTRNRIVSPIYPKNNTSLKDWKEGRAWAIDNTNTYAVGSISREKSNINGVHYTSKAAIWKNGEEPIELNWPSNTENSNEFLAQGSMRDIVISDGYIYGVGFNSYEQNNYYNATVFKTSVENYDTPSNWLSILIKNTQSKINGELIYSNSVAKSINNNLVIIGTAKRSGSKPYKGSASNRIFVIDDASALEPYAIFLSGGIFFDGAGGKVGSINNYNEIVGQLDMENIREKDGKPRRKRAFIYPYQGNGTNSIRSSIFNDRAYFLDDLTYGDTLNTPNGTSSSNNFYRILDATDINDAGVISGTAIKCTDLNNNPKEYDNYTHNSHCDGTERIVAVKLIPIHNTNQIDIKTRAWDEIQTFERQHAGSLVWLALLYPFIFLIRKIRKK